MAIGARRRDIQKLFLSEAIVLALSGGALGIIVGVVATYVVANISQWGFTMVYYPIVIGFVVSALTGIFFGYYPAHRAARLNPIDCLRTD